VPYYFPLTHYYSNLESFVFDSNVEIKKNPYDLNKAKNLIGLSQYALEECRNTQFWVVVSGNISSDSASILVYSLLISLWAAGPVKVFTKYKFRDYNNVIIIHDYFHHNRYINYKNANADILLISKKYYAYFKQIAKRNRRLNTALVTMFFGFISYQWKVAFICFSSALEAILTYDQGKGITKRLAKSYASFTEIKKIKRNKEYRNFINLYTLRSDIMHGKDRKFKNVNKNLWTSPNFVDSKF